MTYHLLFDVSTAGYRAWWWPALGLLFVFIGCGAVLFRKRMGGGLFPFVFLASSVLWTVGVLRATLLDYQRLRDDLISGRCRLVEGSVSHFAAPGAGASAESFDVGSQHFSYSDYRTVAGFHQTSASGGPIRAGLQVKIRFCRGQIARLEIAE
jgi:hypothetical protein